MRSTQSPHTMQEAPCNTHTQHEIPLIELEGDSHEQLGDDHQKENAFSVECIDSLHAINNSDLPLYKVDCNGKPADAMLDSGASATYNSCNS